MVNRLCVIMLGCMALGLLAGCSTTKPPILRVIDFAADAFDPVHETKYYEVNAFRISDWVTVGSEPRLEITVPDTLDLSWNQPKRRVAFADQPVPVFYQHVDTATVKIYNEVGIYRWITNGNDSSCWVNFQLQGLYEGNWELSLRTVDLENVTSQYSEPYQFVIRRVIVPSSPIDVRMWIK